MKNNINYNQIVENSIKEYVISLNENEQDELFRDNWAGLKNAWQNRGNGAGFMNNFVQGRNNYYLKKGSAGQYNPQQQGGMQQGGYPQQQGGNQSLYYQDGSYKGGGDNNQGEGTIELPHENDDAQGNVVNDDEVTKKIRSGATSGTTIPPTTTKKKKKQSANKQTQQQIYMFGEDTKVIEHMREVGEEKANEYRDAIKSLAQRMEWYYTHSNEKTYFGDKEDTIQLFKQFVQYLGVLHEVYMNRYRTIKPNPKLKHPKRDGAEFLEEAWYNPFSWGRKQPPKQTNRTKYGVYTDVDDKDSDSIYAANTSNNLEGKKWIIELRKNTEQLLQYPWFYGKGTTELIKQVIEYLRLDEEGENKEAVVQKKKSGNTLKRLLGIGLMAAIPFLALAPNHANTPTIPDLPQNQIEMNYMESSLDNQDMQTINKYADFLINSGQQNKIVTFSINGANNRYNGQANQQLFNQRAQNIINAFAKKGIRAQWDGNYSNNTNGSTASVSFQLQENKKRNLDKIISEEINRYLRKNLI